MFLFKSQNVYCGYSSSELTDILGALSDADIRCKWKSQNFGGLNRFVNDTDINYSVMYLARVKKKDAEQAAYIVNKTLRSR